LKIVVVRERLLARDQEWAMRDHLRQQSEMTCQPHRVKQARDDSLPVVKSLRRDHELVMDAFGQGRVGRSDFDSKPRHDTLGCEEL